jgi:DNA-binding transcriptional MerR regulator
VQHSDAYWKTRRRMAKDLGYQIDEIQGENKSSKTEVNAEITKHLQTLKLKTDKVLKKLNKLKYASERTEKNFKEEVEKAMDDLKAFVDDIISRYR